MCQHIFFFLYYKMMLKKITSHFNPERFQGWGKSRNYFEGWYFKLIDDHGDHAFAIIPGIAMDEKGEGHSFIQVLDGKNSTAEYHKFSLDSFQADADKFFVRIGDNTFSADHIDLNLENLKGSLHLKGKASWPNPWYAPGIMGPFSWLKFMECNHGIVSMNHHLNGSLNYLGKTIPFKHGKGYIEKDWGSSFPSAYVWMQSNHFEEEDISFKCSVATIPMFGSGFTGFICGLYIKGTFIRFTTYNFSKLKKLEKHDSGVNLELKSPRYHLKVSATNGQTALLASPIQGAMEGRISESMTASLSIQIEDRRSGDIIFKGTGRHAGLEIAGAFDELLYKYKKGRK